MYLAQYITSCILCSSEDILRSAHVGHFQSQKVIICVPIIFSDLSVSLKIIVHQCSPGIDACWGFSRGLTMKELLVRR